MPVVTMVGFVFITQFCRRCFDVDVKAVGQISTPAVLKGVHSLICGDA